MSLRRCACGSLWCEARDLCPAGLRDPWAWGRARFHRVSVEGAGGVREWGSAVDEWQRVALGRWDAIMHQYLRAEYERISRERRGPGIRVSMEGRPWSR